MEGIILIVGLRLGQKQKFLLSERLRCSSILNPMFLKLQQSKEGCDHGNDNAQSPCAAFAELILALSEVSRFR